MKDVAKFKVGDKVKIVKKFASSELVHWVESMDDTVGTYGVISSERSPLPARITSYIVGGWAYLPESLELVNEEYQEQPTEKSIDSHYNFNYSLTQDDIDMGYIKIDPYFVAKQWQLGAKDDSGILFHCLKTLARFGDKNSREREVAALYKQVNRLAELEGVNLEDKQ